MTHELPFIVWGAGGHGRVVADALLAAGHRVSGFVDADHTLTGRTVSGNLAVIGTESVLGLDAPSQQNSQRTFALALGIGSNAERECCYDVMLGLAVMPAVVHPDSTIARSAVVGAASVVLAGARINADARVGCAVIINTAAIVEHDCTVADYAHVSPGAVLTGGVSVGRGAWIGAGAVVLPGLSIGDGAIVGAGAVVTRDAGAGTTVLGNPARLIAQKVPTAT
jgi:sugar O-acyltransferase (sialic acid O-acetyltransferase NeuD family)